MLSRRGTGSATLLASASIEEQFTFVFDPGVDFGTVTISMVIEGFENDTNNSQATISLLSGTFFVIFELILPNFPSHC